MAYPASQGRVLILRLPTPGTAHTVKVNKSETKLTDEFRFGESESWSCKDIETTDWLYSALLLLIAQAATLERFGETRFSYHLLQLVSNTAWHGVVKVTGLTQ